MIVQWKSQHITAYIIDSFIVLFVYSGCNAYYFCYYIFGKQNTWVVVTGWGNWNVFLTKTYNNSILFCLVFRPNVFKIKYRKILRYIFLILEKYISWVEWLFGCMQIEHNKIILWWYYAPRQWEKGGRTTKVQ